MKDKAYYRAYYKANREKMLAIQKAFYVRNREKEVASSLICAAS